MNTTLSLWLGLVFVGVGGLNVWLILQATAQVRSAKASQRLIFAHRIGGYVFVALFCVMAYFMVSRLGDAGSNASSSTIIHMTLAMLLSPLIFVKVLVARYYKSHYSLLMPIGLTIFVLSFVLIGIIAGPAIVSRARRQAVSLETLDLPPAEIDMTTAAATMERRCSKCHNLERVAGARKDAQGWLATVSRMRVLPDSGISDDDARVIVPYLVSQMAPVRFDTETDLEVSRALVDRKCSRCHNLDRIYKTMRTPDEWKATVDKMVGFAADSNGAFEPGETQRIVAYLSATQTPDAPRRARTRPASFLAQAHPRVQTAATGQSVSRMHDRRMLGFMSLVCLGAIGLIVRRPSATAAAARVKSPAFEAAAKPNRPMVLRLASITPQTHDAKTLRFVLPSNTALHARPGQFLTFAFLFDGKKVSRSYSICSSAARSGYVEITVKRVGHGLASVFLNDRARVGLTVETNGPFGHFCFDEEKHRNIVLIAAGSGITPLIAMLRYIDDMCVDVPVTLLYCVRTKDDVIFAGELNALRSRLQRFQYHLLLSQPDPGWTGPRGHISPNFIRNAVSDVASPEFFVCGPPPFMDATRRILIDLGVVPDRIRQESFGGSTARTAPPPPAQTESELSIEFARSRKTVGVRAGQTVLEVAEEHGITIPSFCRQGQCGTCKTKVLGGHVRMDAEHGLDADSKAGGFVLTCVGHPEGEVTLDA